MPARVSHHRVFGFHCDLYGHVNNARYLEFFEAARWDSLGEIIDVHDWHRRGWLFVVVNIEVAFRAPATLGDGLVIETWCAEIGRSSATIHQRARNEQDGRTVAEADVKFVVLDQKSQRPLPIQGEIRAELERLPAQTEEA